MVDCPQGFGDASGERKPICHAVSDADGIFSFKSIPCGKSVSNYPRSITLITLFIEHSFTLSFNLMNSGCRAKFRLLLFSIELFFYHFDFFRPQESTN